MKPFQVALHARPPGLVAGPSVSIDDTRVQTLAVDREAMAMPLDVTFEEAEGELVALPRLFFEPDGSFVWVSPAEVWPAWQVEGNLHDFGPRLGFVDLKGSVPPAEFDDLLDAFGWPAAPVMFQIVRQAVFVGEEEFRRVWLA